MLDKDRVKHSGMKASWQTTFHSKLLTEFNGETKENPYS